MKIAYVYQAGLRYKGHEYLAERIAAMAGRGHQSLVVAPHEGELCFLDGRAPDYRVVPLRFDGAWCAREVKRAVTRFEPDLLHVWTPRALQSRVGIELAVATGAKVVVNYEDPEHLHFAASTGPVRGERVLEHLDKPFVSATDVERWLSELNWPWILRSLEAPSNSDFLHPLFIGPLNQMASGFTGICRPWVERLRQQFRKPTLLLPHAVDLARWRLPSENERTRRELGIDDDAFVVLRAGVVYPGIGDLADFLAGFADFVQSHPRAVLILCGFDHESARTRATLERLGIGDKVRRLGFLEADTYERILSLCDVACCPGFPDDYNRYRLPMKMVDAMLAAKPMICPATGLGEDLEHERDAMLLTTYDADTVASFLSRLCDEPDLRRTLGQHARRRAEEWFDVHRQAKELDAFYQGLLETTTSADPIASAGLAATDGDAVMAQAVARLKDRLARAGMTRIALYGAGQHTRKLLARVSLAPIELQVIVDDAPSVEALAGVQVRAPRELNGIAFDAVVVSSDSIETLLARKARSWVPEGIPIETLYELPTDDRGSNRPSRSS